MRDKVMVQAMELAGQCWCDPETSMIEMDSRLAEAFAKRLAALLKELIQCRRDRERFREMVEQERYRFKDEIKRLRKTLEERDETAGL